ncbi:MAG: M23 family metallopeptidase [Actinomycetota bacterium]|nr:M23 family metallopeptidase [Actinomycetota bacterium]
MLVAAAQRMQAQGWSAARIDHQIYGPFILAGAASWVDTWHALRYGPGSIVRFHEGQDVFCKYGTPVLATQDGTIEFGDDSLGGHVARLHRSDGSYFYYAHLSGWNTKQFSSGDHVQAGDVIGFCGNSGDASGGAPHVHFGWYGADGNAIDPMRMLIGWLHAAEKHVTSLHGGSPTSKEVAAVPVPKTAAPSTAPKGYTFPLVPGVAVSAEVATVPEMPAPDTGDPPDAASVVLWILLAVPLFLPGARRA